MSLASGTFIIFFFVVYLGFWALRGNRRKVLLLTASWVFYAMWDWRFVGLLLLATTIDYAVGGRLAIAPTQRARKALLLLSLSTNLGILAFFKYAGFFIESMTTLLSSLGWSIPQAQLQVVMPVGISFYTFRSLSYTLDIYRGHLKPVRSWLDYAVFVAFFPLLGAGPIVRARKFLPQLAKERRFSAADLDVGFTRFLQGLLLKVLVADTLGFHVVDPVFAAPENYGVAVLWLAMVAFTVQIYADFAGYSSMAIGVSRAFGFKIAENFAFPYLASDLSEFWRRWHISLTSWFRDYLWWTLAKSIPFGGSLLARLRWSWTLVIVFLVSGLWHGAGWTFVVWGGLHGVCLAASQQWRAWRLKRQPEDQPRSGMWALPGWVVTQLLVCLAWVLFRAPDFGSAWVFLRGLAVANGEITLTTPPLVWIAFVVFVAEHTAGYVLKQRPELMERVSPRLRGAFYACTIVLIWYVRPDHANEFIYFQF